MFPCFPIALRVCLVGVSLFFSFATQTCDLKTDCIPT